MWGRGWEVEGGMEWLGLVMGDYGGYLFCCAILFEKLGHLRSTLFVSRSQRRHAIIVFGVYVRTAFHQISDNINTTAGSGSPQWRIAVFVF